MKKLILFALLMIACTAYSQENNKTSNKIIRLEKAALERWDHGDVNGYLELSAKNVTYFDPMLNKRMDGKERLAEYYRPLQGKIHVSAYKMIDPKVQASDSMAVLTFNLDSYVGKSVRRWNCTEVYRKQKDNTWKIIHTHWSYTKPALKP